MEDKKEMVMTDVAKELGVQSFCFRGFKKNEEVIEKVKECGLDRIELCGVHVDFGDEGSFDEVIDLYHGNGVKIVSIGVNGFANDEQKERKLFEFAKKAGMKEMSANFSIEAMPDCLTTAEKLADEYDINLAIHNHGGRHWLGNSDTLKHIFKKTSPRIGLSLDTAWALDSRENPVEWVKMFGDRLYGVHFKDFVFDKSGKPEDVVVGTGNLALPELIEEMRRVDFNGFAVLEYEGDVDNPVPALKKCVESVRAAAGS